MERVIMTYVDNEIPVDYTGFLEIRAINLEEVKTLLGEEEFTLTIKNIEDKNEFTRLVGKSVSVKTKDMRIDEFDILVLYQPYAVDMFKLVTPVKAYRVKPLKRKGRGKKKTSQPIKDDIVIATDIFSRGLPEAAKPILKVTKAAKQTSKVQKNKRQRPVKLPVNEPCFFCNRQGQIMQEIEFTGPAISRDNQKFGWICKFPDMACATIENEYKSVTHAFSIYTTGRTGQTPRKQRERKQREELQQYLRSNRRKVSRRVQTREAVERRKERENREAVEAARLETENAEKLKRRREAAEAAKVKAAREAADAQIMELFSKGSYSNF